MGDRCFMKLIFHASQVRIVEETLGDDLEEYVDDQGDGTVSYDFEEVNYGGIQVREDLVNAGVVFEGWHGSGSDYGPATFLGFKGESSEVDIVHNGGGLVVLMDEDTGEFYPESLIAAKHFIELRKQVRQWFTEATIEGARAILLEPPPATRRIIFPENTPEKRSKK